MAYHPGMEIVTEEDLRGVLRGACVEAGGQTAWAKKHGVGKAYVNDVLAGRRRPGPAILKALGYEAGYRKAGA
jgi:hypothetical protein